MKKLKNMSDVCPNPSDAVRAMVKGLRTARDAKDFRIDMDGFAAVKGAVKGPTTCVGCAGTCAILESLGLWPWMMEYAASRGRGNEAAVENLTGVAWTDLEQWESVIDGLRLGDPRRLCKYYGVAISQYVNIPYLPCLTDSHSEAELQQYETFADALKTAGL